jgi:hypothetical protein
MQIQTQASIPDKNILLPGCKNKEKKRPSTRLPRTISRFRPIKSFAITLIPKIPAAKKHIPFKHWCSRMKLSWLPKIFSIHRSFCCLYLFIFNCFGIPYQKVLHILRAWTIGCRTFLLTLLPGQPQIGKKRLFRLSSEKMSGTAMHIPICQFLRQGPGCRCRCRGIKNF